MVKQKPKLVHARGEYIGRRTRDRGGNTSTNYLVSMHVIIGPQCSPVMELGGKARDRPHLVLTSVTLAACACTGTATPSLDGSLAILLCNSAFYATPKSLLQKETEI